MNLKILNKNVCVQQGQVGGKASKKDSENVEKLSIILIRNIYSELELEAENEKCDKKSCNI